jgi:hypothetical protein
MLVMAFLAFLTRFFQCFLELLDFIGELRKVVVYRITFSSAFLNRTEIGFLLSVLFKPTTITSVVCGIRAPMLLAQVAVHLKVDFLGNPGHRIGTRALLPFLALVGRLLGRFQLALLAGEDAFDCFQRSQKQAHVHRHHALVVHVILILPLKRAHMQYISPYLGFHEWNVLGLGAGIGVGAVVEAWHLGDVGVELLYKSTGCTN